MERLGRGKEPLGTAKLTEEEIRHLYDRHGAPLAAYACCCGLDFASAEDMVQQVFLKLLGGTPRPHQPVPYLYRAVRNQALNLRRNRRLEDTLVDSEACFVHPGAKAEEIFTLQKALSELPDDQREVVFLRVWSGMTLQEIAEATETPLHTSASRYRYALDKLRERLGLMNSKRDQS